MKKLLGICAMIICHSVLAADVFPGYAPRKFTPADPLEVDANIGGYPIWQGEKNWKLFALLPSNSTGTASPVPMGQARVFQTEDKKLISVMQVYANLSEGAASDWTDEPCKREDLLFKASLGGAFRDINCVTINHITGFLNNPGDSWATLYSLLKEEGVEVPPTVLRLTFTRYSSNLRRLVVTLTINPEVVGFQRETESWGRSPWHKTQAFKDPVKKQFIEALADWGTKFAKQMDVAFDKKADAFANIDSWRAIANPL